MNESTKDEFRGDGHNAASAFASGAIVGMRLANDPRTREISQEIRKRFFRLVAIMAVLWIALASATAFLCGGWATVIAVGMTVAAVVTLLHGFGTYLEFLRIDDILAKMEAEELKSVSTVEDGVARSYIPLDVPIHDGPAWNQLSVSKRNEILNHASKAVQAYIDACVSSSLTQKGLPPESLKIGAPV